MQQDSPNKHSFEIIRILHIYVCKDLQVLELCIFGDLEMLNWSYLKSVNI
jgi:hypothetical protein